MIIPIFPLQLIVFPGERVKLHIFEPRYKQMFQELQSGALQVIGIPPVINNQIYSIGTSLSLIAIHHVFNTGEMDVELNAKQVFEITDILNTVNDKLYSGAEINYLENVTNSNLVAEDELVKLYDKFQSFMPVVKKVQNEGSGLSYAMGHYAGLADEQKIELLQIEEEEERQQFLIAHFKKTINVLQDVDNTKKRIEMNGHFRNIEPFKFD